MLSIKQSFHTLTCISIVKLCIIVCVGGLLSASVSLAQNETGQRPCNPAALKFSRVWYPNYSMYQMQYPILRSVPPIQTGMPLDVLFSYIYLDSLLRTVKEQDFRQRLIQWKEMNDTLRYMAQALNTLKEYDPIRFNQFRIETLLQAKHTGPQGRLDPPMQDSALLAENTPVLYPQRYESSLWGIEGEILNRFVRNYDGTDRESMYDVLCSDYIFRATVISVDSMPSKYYLNDTSKNIYDYRVIITLSDTLKGKVMEPISNTSLSITDKFNNRTTEVTQYYQFQYSTFHEQPSECYISPTIVKPDNHFRLVQGQEVIVFLSFYNFLIDCQNDYFDLKLNQQCKSFMLPINNGIVTDGAKIWSDTGSLTYPEWKQKFNTIMQKFSTRNY